MRLLWRLNGRETVTLKARRAATSGQRIGSLSSLPTESTEVTSTATGQQVLQEHEVDGAGAPRRAVTLGNADVGAAAVVPGTRVGRCRDEKREGVELCLPPQDCSPEAGGGAGEVTMPKNWPSCCPGPSHSTPQQPPESAPGDAALCS